jgi:hypothetical protein
MPSDSNKAAALTVKLATEEPETSSIDSAAISQYLATIGRKGGIKGGNARRDALSARRRTAIAKQAAEARWAKKGD